MSSNFIVALNNVLGDMDSYYKFQKSQVLKTMENLYFNSLKGKKVFNSIVISVDMGSLNSTTQQQAVRVRPLDIHDFLLPEPCAVNLCEKAKQAVITMHPVAYSVEIPTQLAPTEGGSVKLLTNQIRVGDIVTCYFGQGPSNEGRMRQLFFKPFTRGQGKRSDLMINCLSKEGEGVKNSFTGFGENASGPKDDPTFSKGLCPQVNERATASIEKRPTKFSKYTEQQVKDTIRKAAPGEKGVQAAMWVIIKKEQPRLSFPANNPAGMQTDYGFLQGLGKSDIDYQTCFKDRRTWRAFAGFSTLQRGMNAFAKSLKAKFKFPAGFGSQSNDQKAEFLTKRYYQTWNLSLTDKQYAQLRKDGYVIKYNRTCRKHNGCKKDSVDGKDIKYGEKYNRKISKDIEGQINRFKEALRSI